MPLTQLELCDFKSYRGHHIIPLTAFTAICGPNGSGKSNLMDAISFVLGVRSVYLRSHDKTDFIYRGRRLRAAPDEPSGNDDDEDVDGEGTATKSWVAVELVDGEKTLHFKRTVSMEGSSEYRLNGKVVAFKAYNDALQEQNILVQAKNFLVFQGDVEAIASQSPKDLTRLIERLSGSLELARQYDEAKKAQDKATESSTFNFTRRRGIVAEIKQFKEQKSEAEKFEKLMNEREQYVVDKILWRLWHIQETVSSNSSDIKKANRDLAKLRDELGQQEGALNEAREHQAKARSEVMRKEKAIKKQEKAVEEKKPAVVAIDTQVQHHERKIQNTEKIIETIQRDTKKQRDTLERYRRDLADINKAADEAQKAQRKASQQGLVLSEGHLEEYRNLKSQAATAAVTERQQVEELTREQKTKSRALGNLQLKWDEFAERKVTLQHEWETWSETLKEAEAKMTDLKSDLANTKQQLDNQQAERSRISQLEAEINERLQDCHQKLLQAGVDQKESERDAKFKETLASLQRILPGVKGRVVDLCTPTARKYETAVSVVLGRNIDAIVVETEKVAIECIEYMRTQRAGQATFIPLDTIKVKPLNDRLRSLERGARLAVDVIQFDPAVERAIHHACGNALVCDNMEIARRVCYDRGQEIKAVTLEGTVIHKSGLITGGKSSHNTGKKWEEKEVQVLHRTRESLLTQMRDLNKTKPRGRADEGLIAEMTRLESTLMVAKEDRNAARSKLQGIKDELKHIDVEMTKIKPELHEMKRAHQQITDEIARLQAIVDNAEDGIFANFCRKIKVANIREYGDRQLKASHDEMEARLRYDTQIARLTHQISFEERTHQQTEERLTNLRMTIESHQSALERLQGEKAHIQEELGKAQRGTERLQEEFLQLNELLEEANKSLDSVKRAAGKVQKAHDKAFKEIAGKNDQIEALSMERTSLYRKCRLEETNLPLKSGNLKDVPMEENIREEVVDEEEEEASQRPRKAQDYGIEVEFDGVDDDDLANAEWGSQLDGKIAKLSAEIEHMAPNMKATERLDDVEHKLRDAEGEADTAKKESKAARDRFNDIKRRRTELFKKAFDHIAERIDQVYKDLTKGKAAPMGGVAYLNLEDSEEPYLSGINYHAMPPMKRFRDMDQLSGGEKTVAALALLFAIHSYQPSPFFVLDEVDAALDNTNVAKIANYIKKHASDTFQFIVISLKGSLYEKSNTLVGIYRDQDFNSSRSLTLDLTQYGD